jgi:hypothetical protein
MVKADKTRLVRIEGEEYIEIDQTTELPNGEETHVPDPGSFAKESVRREIESAAQRAVEQASTNGVVREEDLLERARTCASEVDKLCNCGHLYSVPFIIHCENQPRNIAEKVDFTDLHNALEEVASLCIHSDIQAYAKELARKKQREGEISLIRRSYEADCL